MRYRSELARELNRARSIGDIFELVKRAVNESLGLHRAGLMLGLMELPNAIGALHQLGSNSIIVNRTVLNAVRSLAKSRSAFNAYVFMILTHEYLHSLGVTDESQTRTITQEVAARPFGADHAAAKLARRSLVEAYPELRFLGQGQPGQTVEIVRDFDRSHVGYIS